MYIKLKYDLPLNDFVYIPAGTELEIDDSWNEYDGFIASKYRAETVYFSLQYLEEIPALVECI